jgi:intracellular multiplication protein IcmK
MPLTPEQVRTLLDKFRDSREAAETPMAVPEPRSRVETASLEPGAAPLVINVSPSHVTTVSLLDMTGMPWAIQDVSWAGKIEVDTPEEGGHVLRITPRTAHGVGNISLRLVDLVTPVTLRFQTGLDEVDYRLDVRVPRQGPLAKTPLIEYGGIRSVAGADENLAAVLEGAPAGDAVKMKVDGVDGRTTVWKIAETVYLRTPLTLLSPAWNASAASADGMNVYTLEDTPVILLSDQGRMVKARIMPDGDF